MDSPIQRPYARGDSYDNRWSELAADGQDVHGEAGFVQRLGATSVLDAGCGTGRVAIELARRGVSVVGVDMDAAMLSVAQRKAPGLEWHLADIASVELSRIFDVIVMAGNVMLFVNPSTERQVLENLARYLAPEGFLVAGFQLRPGWLTLADYDSFAERAGLRLHERWSTWNQDPFTVGGDYAVSVHQRPA